jgi:hypothetical protein
MSIGISLEILWDQAYFVKWLACFFDCENFTAFIGSAFFADAVRQFALVAVGALGEAGGGQEVVAAAQGSPSFGVAPFRIRHCSVPFNLSNSKLLD